MPYFTAVLARDGDKWFPRNVDVDALETLDDLADALRAREVGEAEPVLAFIEREDSWWAVVRVDGDEDPRVFVSDVAGAAASTYSELLEVEVDEDAGRVGRWLRRRLRPARGPRYVARGPAGDV